MVEIENECVGCGLPCKYEICPYYRVERRYCDSCDRPATYRIEGDDYCEDCARDYVDEQLREVDLEDALDFLEVDWRRTE